MAERMLRPIVCTLLVTTALADHLWAAKLILIIVTVGQLFCGAAGLTSASRTWYAFSRDRAMPGWWLFRRLNRDKVPVYAVIAVSVAALVISIPALWSTDAAPTFPWAFFAIAGTQNGAGLSLLGLLVLIAGFFLLITRHYPPAPVRPHHGHQSLGVPRPPLCRVDAGRIPPVPSRPGVT